MKTLHLSGLQKIVLQVMETRLHKDQLAETHTLFEQLDVNSDGTLSQNEIKKGLAAVKEATGLVQSAKQIFRGADADGDCLCYGHRTARLKTDERTFDVMTFGARGDGAGDSASLVAVSPQKAAAAAVSDAFGRDDFTAGAAATSEPHARHSWHSAAFGAPLLLKPFHDS
jgi:hypothetical protein